MTPEESEFEKRLLDGARAALLRAAKRARKIARQTGTAVVYMEDGKLIHEYPTQSDADSSEDFKRGVAEFTEKKMTDSDSCDS